MLKLIFILFFAPAFSAFADCDVMQQAMFDAGIVPDHFIDLSQLQDFDRGTPLNYDQLVSEVKVGSYIKTDQNKYFRVYSVLGAGSNHMVLDVGGGWVLRLPRDSTDDYINRSGQVGFYYGSERLSRYGIKIPEINVEASRPPFFMVVKKINVQILLSDFLDGKSKNDGSGIGGKEKKKMEESLLQLARKTWPFDDIADFDTRQIGWDGQEWILLDFRSGSRVISSFKERRTTFDPLPVRDDEGNVLHDSKGNIIYYRVLPKEIMSQVQAVIYEERSLKKNESTIFPRSSTLVSTEYHNILSAGEVSDHLIGKTYQTRPGVVGSAGFSLASGGLVKKMRIEPLTDNQKLNYNINITEYLGNEDGYGIFRVNIEGIGEGELFIVSGKSSTEYEEHEKYILKNLKNTRKGKIKKSELLTFGNDYLLFTPRK